jgi:hypothetical protein
MHSAFNAFSKRQRNTTKVKFKIKKGLPACPAVRSLSPRAGSYDVLWMSRVLLHQVVKNYLNTFNRHH